MRNIILLIAAIAIIAGCSKKNANDETIDKWNGYSHLKDGELVRTLWAGQHDSAGYVTYGIDENANFYATFTTVDGWEMSETHLFAGDKGDMPVNKPGKPKIGHFPYGDDFNPRVTEVTYTIELIELPESEENGFVAAAHAVVHNVNTGKTETAWGFGDYVFSDKGWGWYTTYWYQQVSNPFYIFYGTTFSDGNMALYRIDATNGTADTIYTEAFESDIVAVDGNALDVSTDLFYFTTTSNTGATELNAINLSDETAPSYSVGTLSGTTTSATFYDGSLYYVNEDNSIIQVSFDGTGNIAQEDSLSTIPSSISVNDLAYDPDGGYIYIVGVYDNNTELLEVEVTDESYTYSTTAVTENGNPVTIASDAQIAFGGDDNNLYMISAAPGGGDIISVLQAQTGNVVETVEVGLGDPVDPFGDLTKGIVM
jgi:hypothetical protein